MPTNSTYGWPMATKADMFKPTNMDSLQGAAFDNRVVLERQRHELRVAATTALPSVGDYVGQAAWVDNRNRPYYWTGASWKSASGVEGGTVEISVSWPTDARAYPLMWSGQYNISLPSGRFSAVPHVVVNAYADARVVWGSLLRKPTSTSSFPVRIIAVTPGAPKVTVSWVAVDSN